MDEEFDYLVFARKMLSGEQNHPPKKIKSSVAICTCDGESFIAEQLESIASQSVPVDPLPPINPLIKELLVTLIVPIIRQFSRTIL